jgi:hypothetical protein
MCCCWWQWWLVNANLTCFLSSSTDIHRQSLISSRQGRRSKVRGRKRHSTYRSERPKAPGRWCCWRNANTDWNSATLHTTVNINITIHSCSDWNCDLLITTWTLQPPEPPGPTTQAAGRSAERGEGTKCGSKRGKIRFTRNIVVGGERTAGCTALIETRMSVERSCCRQIWSTSPACPASILCPSSVP